ncbi:MAG: DUF3298 domain-containing protein [Eubacteriales bacterium]|nr:DUF3298 domain-containing protein [Eubacteriales bacterium]
MKKNNMKKVILKRSLGLVAGLLAVLTIALNLSPVLAKAMLDVPVIGDVVNVLTFGRFQYVEGGFSADIKTPGIEGLVDKELEKLLNDELRDKGEAVKNKFFEEVEELRKLSGNGDAKFNVTMDYAVRTNDENYLSLDVILTTTGASAAEAHTFYNIDKKTGKIITLDELVDKKAVKEYILEEMARRNAEEDGTFFIYNNGVVDDNTKKALNNIEKFYINDKGEVVVVFDEYEVAAGVQGSPEFILPKSLMK